MGDLINLINTYLLNSFKVDNDKLYFGILSEWSSNQSEFEKAIILKNEFATGYLVINDKNSHHSVSYSGEEETFYFNVFPRKICIEIEPLQITKEELVIREAAVKEDWVTPPSYKIIQAGDYSLHRELMETAARKFEEKKIVELWLPYFLREI